MRTASGTMLPLELSRPVQARQGCLVLDVVITPFQRRLAVLVRSARLHLISKKVQPDARSETPPSALCPSGSQTGYAIPMTRVQFQPMSSMPDFSSSSGSRLCARRRCGKNFRNQVATTHDLVGRYGSTPQVAENPKARTSKTGDRGPKVNNPVVKSQYRVPRASSDRSMRVAAGSRC